MKKIIALLIALLLLISSFCVTAFATVAELHFDTDVEIVIEDETFEYNRSVKFVINYPKNTGESDVMLNNVLYEDIHVALSKIYDTNGILEFSNYIDTTPFTYEGYFVPIKSGETQIVTEFKVYGFSNGNEIELPGEHWRFSCTTDTLTVEEIEEESGYFESSYEDTFDVSSYYAQQYQEEMSNMNTSSETTQIMPGKSNIWVVILTMVLSLCVLVVAFVVIRNHNIKKYRKRR